MNRPYNISYGEAAILIIVILVCFGMGIWSAIGLVNDAISIKSLEQWTLIDSGKPIVYKVDSECYPTEYKVIIGSTEFDDRYVWTMDTGWDGHSTFRLSDMNTNKHYSAYTRKASFPSVAVDTNYLLIICDQ